MLGRRIRHQQNNRHKADIVVLLLLLENMVDDKIDNPYSFDDDAKEYVFAYLDVLGYRDFFKRNGCQELYFRIRKAYRHAVTTAENFSKKPAPAPTDLKVKMYSDNMLLYLQLNGDFKDDSWKEVFLILVCELFQFFSLLDGLMIRGAISRGKCVIDDFVFGEAFIEAYELESKAAKWSRIVISDKVIKDLKTLKYIPGTSMLRKDEDGLHYVDYLGGLVTVAEKNSSVEGFVPVKTLLEDHRDAIRIPFTDYAMSKHPVTIDGLKKMGSINRKYKSLMDYHNLICTKFGYDKEPNKLTLNAEPQSEKLRDAIESFYDAFGKYSELSSSASLHDKLNEVLKEYDELIEFMGSPPENHVL